MVSLKGKKLAVLSLCVCGVIHAMSGLVVCYSLECQIYIENTVR